METTKLFLLSGLTDRPNGTVITKQVKYLRSGNNPIFLTHVVCEEISVEYYSLTTGEEGIQLTETTFNNLSTLVCRDFLTIEEIVRKDETNGITLKNSIVTLPEGHRFILGKAVGDIPDDFKYPSCGPTFDITGNNGYDEQSLWDLSPNEACNEPWLMPVC